MYRELCVLGPCNQIARVAGNPVRSGKTKTGRFPLAAVNPVVPDIGWGEGTSPVLHGDWLIVNWDHEGQSFLVILAIVAGELHHAVLTPAAGQQFALVPHVSEFVAHLDGLTAADRLPGRHSDRHRFGAVLHAR